MTPGGAESSPTAATTVAIAASARARISLFAFAFALACAPLLFAPSSARAASASRVSRAYGSKSHAAARATAARVVRHLARAPGGAPAHAAPATSVLASASTPGASSSLLKFSHRLASAACVGAENPSTSPDSPSAPSFDSASTAVRNAFVTCGSTTSAWSWVSAWPACSANSAKTRAAPRAAPASPDRIAASNAPSVGTNTASSAISLAHPSTTTASAASAPAEGTAPVAAASRTGRATARASRRG